MLFMGSKKYPKENEYSKFISDNGGYDNAYTTMTDTNFHFECSNESFEGALDRFASIFASPLLAYNSAEREMKSVDSEFKSSL
jgi:secreted Zn-dependent insulinase-like peptidase